MAFSTLAFLLVFLPLTLAGYYLIKDKISNIFLLIASLVFYMWGGLNSVLILVSSIVFNYLCALLIGYFCKGKVSRRTILIIDILGNVGLLCTYKYLTYALGLINSIGGLSIPAPDWAVPLGLSFFTFSALSYVLDVFFGTSKAEKNLFNVALYITFFPKMISGPIVKWNDFQSQLNGRKFVFSDLSDGIVRFIVGLGKKVLIADMTGIMVDRIFDKSDLSTLPAAAAWFGILGYFIQLYFDFSGYSDMAIGLGKMFGFHFKENFNYPYCSSSVSEFWRRWHISLGAWFRDYIYIPLGGSRTKTKARHVFNLFVVWMLTGIWHGASWNFVAWGLMYFVLITFEKLTGLPQKLKHGWSKALYRVFTLLCVLFGWVLFRSGSLTSAFEYYGAMFGLHGNGFIDGSSVLLIMDNLLLMAVGVLFSMPVIPKLKQIAAKNKVTGIVCATVEPLVLIGILVVAISFSTTTSYDPFIYFNF